MNSKSEEIINAIKKIKTSAIIGIDTETSVKLLGGKKNPMQDRVTKVILNGNVMVFGNLKSHGYMRMVKRRLQDEGKDPDSFELQPRKWGARIPETCFVEHKGELYIEVIFLRKPTSIQYLLDGKPIDKRAIEGLKDALVNEESQGGLDNKVQIRTYKLESIKSMRIGKRVI